MAAAAAPSGACAEPLLAAGDPHVVLNKAGVIVRAGVSKSSALVGDQLFIVGGYSDDWLVSVDELDGTYHSCAIT